MVSALYVIEDGIYSNYDVDMWHEGRDARNYRGPNPVVAHPPCKRWGKYWMGGPSSKKKHLKGDDGGCFAHALWAVRTFGGVIEHPHGSNAWEWFGIEWPANNGGWSSPDRYGGRSCCVEQGHYGHKSKKPTWLYAVNADYMELTWGKSDPGRTTESLGPIQRITTPRPFAEALLCIASKDRNYVWP